MDCSVPPASAPFETSRVGVNVKYYPLSVRILDVLHKHAIDIQYGVTADPGTYRGQVGSCAAELPSSTLQMFGV